MIARPAHPVPAPREHARPGTLEDKLVRALGVHRRGSHVYPRAAGEAWIVNFNEVCP